MSSKIRSVSYVYGNGKKRPATWGAVTYSSGKQRVINFARGELAPRTVVSFIMGGAVTYEEKTMKQTGDTVVTWYRKGALL